MLDARSRARSRLALVHLQTAASNQRLKLRPRARRRHHFQARPRRLLNGSGGAPQEEYSYLTYLLRKRLWKSLRTVSLMNRLPSFFGSRLWFLKTTSSSHRRLTANEELAPSLGGSSRGLLCRTELSSSAAASSLASRS